MVLSVNEEKDTLRAVFCLIARSLFFWKQTLSTFFRKCTFQFCFYSAISPHVVCFPARVTRLLVSRWFCLSAVANAHPGFAPTRRMLVYSFRQNIGRFVLMHLGVKWLCICLCLMCTNSRWIASPRYSIGVWISIKVKPPGPIACWVHSLRRHRFFYIYYTKKYNLE